MARLIGLEFKIVYRQGAENHAADAIKKISVVHGPLHDDTILLGNSTVMASRSGEFICHGS
jgi:hypothetical protein